MEKKYEQPEENNSTLNEPIAAYQKADKSTILPPPTEEELKECITGDELIEYMYDHIHKLFNGK